MKNTARLYIYAWVILVVVFNIVVFATPTKVDSFNKFGGAFIASYLLVMAALIGQAICTLLTVKKSKNIDQFFLNIPVIRISYAGLIITTIIAAVCFAIPDLPNWVAAVIGVVVLALLAISITKTTAAAELIVNQKTEISSSTECFRNLSARAEVLYKSETDTNLKKEICHVYESFKYSAPRGNESVREFEDKITQEFETFVSLLQGKNIDEVKSQEDVLIKLVNERNSQLKMQK